MRRPNGDEINGYLLVAMYVVGLSCGLYLILDWAGGSSFSGVAAITSLLIASLVTYSVTCAKSRRFADMKDLKQEAIRLEAAADSRAQLAVVEERARIAREMHDVIAHGMGLITVQASAAQEIALHDPEKVVEVLGNIEHAGRGALCEMRRMVGVLRANDESPASLSPQPGLADIASAVEQSNKTGLPTRLVITGQPQDLPTGIELTAFRIAQEGLTNVLKHAGSSATAEVTLSYQPESLTIEVADNGRGAASSLSDTGGGNGLIGMRERTEMYGGDFTAKPTLGGGYAVRAEIPIGRPAAARSPATMTRL